MCGLAGFAIRDRETVTPLQAERLLDRLLEAVDYRGKDATGCLAITPEGRTLLLKAALAAKAFNDTRPGLPLDTLAVIGHTRLATQGAPEWAFNNHPVRVGDTFLAHNGHVSNQTAIREKVGQPMQTVDSALIAALVESSDHPVKALDSMHTVEGAAAVTYWAKDHPDTLVLARVSSSPLYVWRGRKAIVWASTQSAVIDSWKAVFGGRVDPRKVRSLSEGEAVVVTLSSGKTEPRWFKRPPERYHFSGDRYSYGATSHALPAPKSPVVQTRAAKVKAKAKGGKGSPTPSPAVRGLPRVTLPAGWNLTDDATRGMSECESCGDWFGALTLVDIGGESFQMCQTCADWADAELYGSARVVGSAAEK